ncbi:MULTISPECIES: hypothetical protein [unclassified Microcoleus]|uniref:hypothetical protein n=1 Tax=unclassified Microcoleus TaxID=2642155 RepID=UPI002FD1ADC3
METRETGERQRGDVRGDVRSEIVTFELVAKIWLSSKNGYWLADTRRQQPKILDQSLSSQTHLWNKSKI